MFDRALSGQPNQDGRCRVCQAPLRDANGRCERCGAVHGEAFRCPHCRAITDIEFTGNGRQRCKACGGPRLVIQDGKVALSGDEREALRRARSHLMPAQLWRFGGWALLGAGALSLVIALLFAIFASPGVLVGTLGLALGALPLLAGLGALRRASGGARELERAWHDAELSAAKDLAHAAGAELTAASLARALGIDEMRAELVLAELSLEDVIQRRVTDTGDLAYSSPPRVRVEQAGDLEAEREAAAANEGEPEPERARASKGEPP